MKLVKEVSFSQAAKNLKEAALKITDNGERYAVLVAILQLQDALEREGKYVQR